MDQMGKVLGEREDVFADAKKESMQLMQVKNMQWLHFAILIFGK